MPISSTSTSVSAGAPRMVTGRPCSLLKLRSFAATRRPAATAARTRSFVDVLPTLPVMPTTVAARRARAHVANVINAAAVSATSTTGIAVSTGRDASVAAAPRAAAAATKSWPSRVGDERDEQLARAQRAGVERRAVDVDVGPAQRATGGGSHVGRPDPHRAERYRRPHARGPDPPRRAVRRPVRRARRQLRHRDGRPRRRRPAALPHHADRHLPGGRVGARRRRPGGVGRRAGRAARPPRPDGERP